MGGFFFFFSLCDRFQMLTIFTFLLNLSIIHSQEDALCILALSILSDCNCCRLKQNREDLVAFICRKI